MQSSYLRAGLYALGAVLALLWIDFRSLAHSLLAMTPLAIGAAMMCGCLGWLDIPLNPANMIILPLILGIGVDHGVHLVHLWRQQRGRFVLGDATTVAVLLTAATTTASFGALILARHQGLQSLGQALTLGVTTCLMASIIFFPALLAWLARHRPALAEGDESCVAAAPASAPIGHEALAQPLECEPAAVADAVSQTAALHHPEPRELAPGETSSRELTGEASSRKLIRAEAAGNERASAPAEPIDQPLHAAPVTDDEIAALLDAAFLAQGVHPAWEAASDFDGRESPAALPRRRNLPRRSEAA
jgi:hypothetical protein